MIAVRSVKRYPKWKKPVTEDHTYIIWFHLQGDAQKRRTDRDGKWLLKKGADRRKWEGPLMGMTFALKQ